MANKTLSVKLSLNDKQFQSNLKKATRAMKKFGRNMKQTGKSLTRNLTLPIVAMGTASVIAFDKQAKAIAQVEAGIKSTGQAAGFTSDELQKMASDLQNKTIFGDEDILQNATAQLLTFTNIAGEQFERTQEAALDLATRLDGDLKSASIQLGKALNDPVANLSALSRSGIQFSTSQKEVIKSLAESGRLAEAQTIILDELNNQYGGAAEAAAQAGLGGFQQLKNELGDLSEEFGKLILENIEPFKKSIRTLIDRLRGLTDEQRKTLIQFAGYASVIGPAIFIVGKLASSIALVIKNLRLLTAFAISNPFVLLATAATALVGIMGFAILDTEKFIVTALKMGKVGRFIAKTVLGALSAINPKYQVYFTLVDKAGEESEQLEKSLKDSTDEINKNKEAIDNLNKSLENLNKTQGDGGRVATPVRSIKPITAGKVENNLGIPTKLDPIDVELPTDKLESFEEAFFDFSDSFKESLQNTFNQIGNGIGQISNLFNLQHEKRMTEIENQKEAEINRINSLNISEEDRAKKLKQLDKDIEMERKHAQKRQAKRSKAIAILDATVATAAAVVQSLPNIPLSIAVGALGAAQVATIASTPIPAFADGGLVSGATLGLIGEGPGTSVSNPEVIAPLDKLKNMIGGQAQKVIVEGVISGEDIFLTNERQKIIQGR
jgi:hypothetical protein